MIAKYTSSSFIDSLSKSNQLLCTDDFNYGLVLRRPAYALEKKYIQANNDFVIMFLIIDLDHDDPMIFEKVNLPSPNFITIDKIKRTSHYCYALKVPIPRNYNSNLKALRLFSLIEQEYTRLLKGDPSYVGRITKNPLSSHWQTWNLNSFYSYDLYELADYIELPKRITKKHAIGEGRNCYLFETIRKIAYKEVLFYKENGANELDFRNVILDKLIKHNVFEQSLPLGINELNTIAKSISKWTWERFSSEKYSEIQSSRSRKREVVKTKHKNIDDLLNSLDEQCHDIPIKELAVRLNVSTKTVKNYLKDIGKSSSRKQYEQRASERINTVWSLRQKGLKFNEIASILGISANNARQLAHRYKSNNKSP